MLRATCRENGTNELVTDAVLVVAARAGDVGACEALFRRHVGLALGLAERILAGRDDAEDIVQDAFVEVFDHLVQLERPQAFAAWLASIVVRRASRSLRRQRLLARLGLRTERPVEPDALIAHTAPPDVACELRAVYGCLSRLPVNEGVALLLRRVEGLELGEIAEHLQLSLATVKRRLTAAEARLQRERQRAPASSVVRRALVERGKVQP